MPNTQFRWTTTVANLMNEASMVNGEIDVVQGYGAAGDGGGGVFYFDTTILNPEKVTGAAAASGSNEVEITTQADHLLLTGSRVWIGNVVGVSAANGIFTITVTASNKFTLNGTTFSGSYSSGGGVGDGGKTIPSNSGTVGIWRRLM